MEKQKNAARGRILPIAEPALQRSLRENLFDKILIPKTAHPKRQPLLV
jgi:hypothetical protein